MFSVRQYFIAYAEIFYFKQIFFLILLVYNAQKPKFNPIFRYFAHFVAQVKILFQLDWQFWTCSNKEIKDFTIIHFTKIIKKQLIGPIDRQYLF